MADEKQTAFADVKKEALRSGSGANGKMTALADVEKETVRSGSVVPDKILKHAKDADEAMKAFEGHEGAPIALDEATNKRLLRIIDWNILPVSTSVRNCLSQSLTLIAANVRCLWPQLPRQYVSRSYSHKQCITRARDNPIVC